MCLTDVLEVRSGLHIETHEGMNHFVTIEILTHSTERHSNLGDVKHGIILDRNVCRQKKVRQDKCLESFKLGWMKG